jgi:hypothetical protein
MRSLWILVCSGLIVLFSFSKGNAQSLPVKDFLKAVAEGRAHLATDFGRFNPFFRDLKALSHYEDEDLYIAAGHAQDGRLVFYTWLKQPTMISLAAATERWMEVQLAEADTQEKWSEWRNLRRIIRAPFVQSQRAHSAPFTQITFGEGFQVEGWSSPEATLHVLPMIFVVETSPLVRASFLRP